RSRARCAKGGGTMKRAISPNATPSHEMPQPPKLGVLRTWLSRQTRGTRLAVAAAAVAVLAVSGYRAYCAAAAASQYRAAQAAAARDDLPAARRHLTACLAEWPNDGEINF